MTRLYILNKPLKVLGLRGEGLAYGIFAKSIDVQGCLSMVKAWVKMELARQMWMNSECEFTRAWCEKNCKVIVDDLVPDCEPVWSYLSDNGIVYKTSEMKFPKEFYFDLTIKEVGYSINEALCPVIPLLKDFDSANGVICLTSRQTYEVCCQKVRYNQWIEVDDKCVYPGVNWVDNSMYPLIYIRHPHFNNKQ